MITIKNPYDRRITTLTQAELTLRSAGIINDCALVNGIELLRLCKLSFGCGKGREKASVVLERLIARYKLIKGEDFMDTLVIRGDLRRTVYAFTEDDALWWLTVRNTF